MSAAWATVLGALVALAGLLGVVGGRLWRGGRREGKVDQVLEDLTQLVGDHEDRIRLLEHRPPRRARR